MILLIDNYDSFVYNLARYVSELGYQYQVVRNDAITCAEIKTLQPSHIILSPGPGAPDQAGICLSLIKQLAGQIPILGVCLGHQAIGQAFGARVGKAKQPMHGKASIIAHHQQNLFQGIPSPITPGRYHSLIVENETIPATLEVTAFSTEGEVMALQHRKHAVYGVQFHPESVLTDVGYQLLGNFLAIET